MASIEELFASMYESFDRRQGLMVECLRLMEKMTTPPSPEMKEEDSTVTTTEETLDDVPEAQLHPVAVPCAQIHHNAKGLLRGTTTTGFSVGESKLGYTVATPPQIHFIGNHNPQLQRDFTWMLALGVSFNVLAIDTSPSVAADRNSLNTLAIDTGRRWKDPWRWFDESMPDCCEPLDKVKAQTCPYICSATTPTNCSTELLKDVAAFHPVYMITEDFVFDPGITAEVYWGKYRTILAFAALYPYFPVRARRSAVTLQKDGNMVLTDYDGTIVWQADGNFTKVQHAQLLNTGNLVINDSSGSTVWQSFDSPTDTFLPTQHITATAKLVPTTQSHNPGKNITRRLTLDPDGNLRMYSWNESNRSWSVSMQAMSQLCNIHGLCGPNGICHYSPKPTCSCPPGYVMRNKGNWTQGCASIVNITCDHYDQETMKFVKLPDTDFWGSDQQHLLTKSLKECRNICISDCTCKGFQYQEGTGSCYPKAYLFSGRTYPTSDVRTIYIKLSKKVNESNFRIPHSGVFHSSPNHLVCDQMSKNIRQPFPDVHRTGGRETKWFYFYGFIAALFVVEVLFISFAWFFVLRRENWPSEIWAAEEGYKIMSSNFRRYSYRELVKATRKFKVELGRGGSGTVYKGILEDDRPVAVKKLENVKQGKEEFQSELSIIGRINHMNLVRIWGFCSEGSHRLLVSEYVENGSLADILFNGKSYTLLDWKGRFNISLGVARGLAYLHHECLEWVIHCDVKPENILLDQNFEPKITDFGLAKLLSRGGPNQNVSHIRGTLGYIAPEWASSLPITAKVDVYSYGVVLIELLSGTRVSELLDGSDEVHMVQSKLVRTFANKSEWEEQSWIDDFVDPKLSQPLNYVQARTLIRLAVSCLDEDRDKRPTMESIVQTLLSVDD